MKILFIGDITGGAGRKALFDNLPGLINRWSPDLVIANGENAAGGAGITKDIYHDFKEVGVDIITLGNHLVARGETVGILDSLPDLLRPANLASIIPGRGFGTFDFPFGPVGVIVVSGRVFMAKLECPFKAVDRILEKMPKSVKNIIVEIHAEATSEKIALGWHLAGRVSGVIGTHTHVQTADNRILPGGTAYITDVGMTGPFDSVLGIKKDIIIRRFINQMPEKFDTARKDPRISAFFMETDKEGKGIKTERIFYPPFE